MTRALLAAIGVCAWASCPAQWGVRFAPFHYDRVSSTEKTVKWQVGFGLDFDTGLRTGISILATYGPELPFLDIDAPSITLRAPSGSEGYYTRSSSCYGVALRSIYFMRDNDDVAPYVAVRAGIRFYNAFFTLEDQYDDYYGPVERFPDRFSHARTLFPIGFDVGVRDALSTFYSELYFSLGFQIGSGVLEQGKYEMVTDALLSSSEKPARITGLTYGMGWAIGFGSERKRKERLLP